MDNEPILIDPIKEAIESAIKNLNFANELASKRETNEQLLRENKEMFREIDALNLRLDMRDNELKEADDELRTNEEKTFFLEAQIRNLEIQNADLIKRLSKYE